MVKTLLHSLLACLVLLTSFVSLPAQQTVPPLQREFRGAWVASVSNINWPSKPGLSVNQQKAELLAILDYAARIHLNAVILQVRPACDALYRSRYEPWSEYLTGKMGVAPSPSYDPLEFAVSEAHKRGLELHAWINPYRARHPSAKSPISSKHISKTRPQLVRKYGGYLWLDPSEPDVRRHSRNVLLDIVSRYDVDGIHMDDYFYPYKEKGADGKVLDFPDEKNWSAYKARGGRLSRSDWRREQVNLFIRDAYAAVKGVKPAVKFGISPFGIWKPGYPAQIKGLNAYEELYADSKKWLENGWVDYFTPQLYWPTTSEGQNFKALSRWWAEQNRVSRHLWPGLNTSGASKWGNDEIIKQIGLTRDLRGSDGHVHWHFHSISRNRRALSDALLNGPYATPAVVPASPWLGKNRPMKPVLSLRRSGQELKLSFRTEDGSRVWLWAVQVRSGGKWTTRIVPGGERSTSLGKGRIPELIAVRAISRTGMESEPAIGKPPPGR